MCFAPKPAREVGFPSALPKAGSSPGSLQICCCLWPVRAELRSKQEPENSTWHPPERNTQHRTLFLTEEQSQSLPVLGKRKNSPIPAGKPPGCHLCSLPDTLSSPTPHFLMAHEIWEAVCFPLWPQHETPCISLTAQPGDVLITVSRAELSVTKHSAAMAQLTL